MKKRKWVVRKCEHCGKEFNAIPSEVLRGRGRFCHKQCYLDWRYKKRVIECQECGKSFERHNIKRKFCSYECWLTNWRRERPIKITRTKDRHGYIMIRFTGGKPMFEHRYVWEKTHGKLSKDWVVHHLNGDKEDNRIDNLHTMPRKVHNARKIVEPYQERIMELEEELGIKNQSLMDNI